MKKDLIILDLCHENLKKNVGENYRGNDRILNVNGRQTKEISLHNNILRFYHTSVSRR